MKRLEANPLLSPADVKPTRADLEVVCTMNPAAVRFGGEVLLLVRVAEKAPDESDAVTLLVYDADAGELKTLRIPRGAKDLDTSDPRKIRYRGRALLTTLSHLRLARSTDGVHFTFDEKPAIFPASPYEAYGCEDARITPLDGRYYITYTAVSDRGVAVAMASTDDFRQFQRHGLIFPPYQKDVCLFPAKLPAGYVCRHRPYKSRFNEACIWTAYSPDLLSWGRHEMTLAPAPGTWQGGRVGAGAPPVLTEAGWLEIYHAAGAEGSYALGAMLSDAEHPERLISHSSRPVLQPEADYELKGMFNNVVFSNGMIVDDDGTMTVYYGAADTICAAAVTTVDEMLAAAMNK